MDRAGRIGKIEGVPVTGRELQARERFQAATGQRSGMPEYLEEYLLILQKKFASGEEFAGQDFDTLDGKRYGRILSGMTPEQAQALTQAVDEEFKFRPDVAEVIEVKRRLFPQLMAKNRDTQPPAIAQAYTPLLEQEYYAGSKPVYGQRLLPSAPQEAVNLAGLEMLAELIGDLGHRMTADERRTAERLREQRIKDSAGKKGLGTAVPSDIKEVTDRLLEPSAAEKRRLQALRFQTEQILKEGNDCGSGNEEVG